MGISAVQGARLAGASRIFGVDPVAGEREQALRFGVTDAVDPAGDDLAEVCTRSSNGGIGVDHALDTAATSGTMTACVSALRSGDR